jgi:quinol monooxygenase YgiN
MPDNEMPEGEQSVSPGQTYFVTFKVKQEHAEAFAGMLEKVKIELPKVPGCTGLQVLRHSDDEDLCFVRGVGKQGPSSDISRRNDRVWSFCAARSHVGRTAERGLLGTTVTPPRGGSGPLSR